MKSLTITKIEQIILKNVLILRLKQCIILYKRKVGKVFVRVLEDAGVYKRDEKGQAAFMRFVDSVGLE